MTGIPASAQLKRVLGPAALVAYGVGDVLGAGIYALTGKVAGLVGNAAWLAFLVAFGVASLTGLSYCELGSRFPRSAGESVFCLEAFRKPLFSYLIGFLVLLSGLVSMAAVSHAFSGYVRALFPRVPSFVLIFAFLSVLAVINYWGMRGSSWTNIVCMVVEVVGICVVIYAGLRFFGKTSYASLTPPPDIKPHAAILQASVLAFYAFIGFEDIVNVAEETHEPSKSIPVAILGTLFVASVIYMLVSIAAVSAVPAGELAASKAPLLLVVQRGVPAVPPGLFVIIAIFAVTNTALVNFVMGSRILYGMSREGLVPASLGRVHPKRHTPYIAIGAVFAVALVLALSGSLVILAQSTSLLLLLVFTVMNVSLIVIKKRSPEAPFRVPAWIPWAGAVCCLGLVFYIKPGAFLIMAVLVALGILLFTLQLKAASGRFRG